MQLLSGAHGFACKTACSFFHGAGLDGIDAVAETQLEKHLNKAYLNHHHESPSEIPIK